MSIEGLLSLLAVLALLLVATAYYAWQLRKTLLSLKAALHRAEAAGQDLAGEGLVGHGRHVGVEGEQVETVDAERGQGPAHLAGTHQAEGGGGGLEPAAWMRIEADHGERGLQRTGGAGGLGDDGLVAPMHAVEGADGHRGALQLRRQVAPVADDLDHGRRLSGRRACGGAGRGRRRCRP